MAAYENRIKQLISLAEHSSEVNRELVYRKLVALLLDKRVESDEDEMSALLRLLDALTPSVGMDCRIEIARMVAGQTNAPMALAEHIATDLASVAAPILKKTAFDEAALLRIIGATGRAHHLLIAERPGLTARIWDALSRRPIPDSRKEPLPAAGPPPAEPASIQTVPRQPRGAEASLVATLTRDPAHDLAALARGYEAPSFLLDDPAGGFAWATNRQGRISGLSPHAREAFGRTAQSLKGFYFFTLIEPLADSADGHRFGTILTRHLPIRDLPIEIENNKGRQSRWLLRGQARFDPSTGRFTGYRGQALDDRNEDRGKNSAAREPASLDAILSRRVAADARIPIGESLAAALRLRKKIAALGDADLMADLTGLMDGCYGMRDLMEDMENTLAADERLLRGTTRRFGMATLVKECLRENLLRHGGVSRLRLETGARDIPATFDRRLAYQAVARMLRVAEARADIWQDETITISRAANGKSEIRVPLATSGGGFLDEEILFSPAAFLRRRPALAQPEGAQSLPPEFGLSAVRLRLRGLGGNIYLGRDPDGSRWLALDLPTGS
ncbi:MAG: hypothetical protein IID51_07025 [Proteobacteria bacterium]|nr:hypothetical protein [Pseudomonadota bacterium]